MGKRKQSMTSSSKLQGRPLTRSQTIPKRSRSKRSTSTTLSEYNKPGGRPRARSVPKSQGLLQQPRLQQLARSPVSRTLQVRTPSGSTTPAVQPVQPNYQAVNNLPAQCMQLALRKPQSSLTIPGGFNLYMDLLRLRVEPAPKSVTFHQAPGQRPAVSFPAPMLNPFRVPVQRQEVQDIFNVTNALNNLSFDTAETKAPATFSQAPLNGSYWAKVPEVINDNHLIPTETDTNGVLFNAIHHLNRRFDQLEEAFLQQHNIQSPSNCN